MSIKRTEVGVRDQLINELKELLGIKYYIAEECSIKHREHFIKWKGRNQPDILVFNKEFIKMNEENIEYDDQRAIVSVIDTKSFNEDITKDKYLGQLYRYMADLNVNHGFITNLKDVASHHLTLKRLRKKSSCSDAKEVAKWIVDCITDYYGHLPIPLSITQIIESLNTSMMQLMNYAKLVSIETWEDILKISNLEDEALYKNEDEKINARYRGAAFVILSQLLFYIILRTSRINLNQNMNPTLRPLMTTNGIPDQIQELLNDIKNEINYKAIYKFEVFPKLPDSASEIIKGIIETFEGLSNELVIQHDLIGLLFQRLIPFDLRKKLAAYYTKPLAAELLTRLTFETGDETVIDPACGSGTLLVHSYLQKRRILGINSKHKKLLSEIIGSDISVFATILASVNLAIQNPGKWTNKVNIFNENAFNLPKAQIERFIEDTLFIKKLTKQTSNGTEVIERPGITADVVIMNPPFTRGSRLTNDERKILLKVSEIYGLKHGWRDWNLYSSFILLAPSFLKVGKKGIISLVLPHATISTRYMEKVWQKFFTQTNLGMKYIINASLTEISFSDSSEQELLLVLQKGYKKPCKMIQLTKELKEYDIEELAEEIKKIEKEGKFPSDSNYFEGHQIDQKDFQVMKSREWSFSPPGILELLQRDFIPLENMESIETGGGNHSTPVDYFWIPNKYWELIRESENDLILKQTLETQKILLTIKNVNENYNSSEDIPENMSKLFINYSQSQIKKLIKKIPEEINIPKIYLVKSLVRKLKDMENQPPCFNENFPYIFFLNYSKLKNDNNNKYYLWGEILRETLANWVSAPPRSGKVFFPVKIRLNTMKTLVIRSPELLDCARVAGISLIPGDNSEETNRNIDLIFAYLTSSIFLLDFIKKSRIISGALRQLLSTDLNSLMIFPNVLELSPEIKEEILNTSKNYNSNVPLRNRPIFSNMISFALKEKEKSLLRKLDKKWFKALEIPVITLDTLYNEILKELSIKRIK
ncbi:hypothetical protein LCGC14_0594930 [marine sediment metagenome]|uniref:DNA methylase adenine-specific domain-containing protein n=1 Tax=marine sediment metagenome TaxID=412755 RepID=A0A0F9RCD2_9ZZZZ